MKKIIYRTANQCCTLLPQLQHGVVPGNVLSLATSASECPQTAK